MQSFVPSYVAWSAWEVDPHVMSGNGLCLSMVSSHHWSAGSSSTWSFSRRGLSRRGASESVVSGDT